MLSAEEKAALEPMLKAQFASDKVERLGPFLIGCMIDIALWGFLTQQYVSWVMHGRRKERLFTKIIVHWVMFVSTVVTVYVAVYVIDLFVVNNGSYFQFIDLSLLGWCPLIESLTTVPVQLYYMDRAHKLVKSWWLLAVLVPLILAHLAAACVARWITYQITLLQATDFRWVYYLWIGTALSIDTIITGTILYKLVSARSGENSDNRLVNRLIKLSIESQLPSTLIAFALMVSYGVRPTSFIFVLFLLFHTKVYAIPMLAVINSRKAMRRTLGLTMAQSEAVTTLPPLPYPTYDSGPILTLDSEAKGMDISECPPYGPDDMEMSAFSNSAGSGSGSGSSQTLR